MDAVRKYHQLALDCLNLAEATRDPATQNQMFRLAEFCAKLAEDSEEKIRPVRVRLLDRAKAAQSTPR